METDIQKFFRNKSVFLTGGSGFVGKVFIEKLLRVTAVKQIYVLIRPKRNRDINERISDIFKDPLFEKLTSLQENAIKRVTPIFGDCVLRGLGLSEEDRQVLIDNVDVVVHSAATVRFDEPLRTAMVINVRSTMDMLKLAREMPKLLSFVHVSTAFANCPEAHIDEIYYTHHIGTTADNACKMVDMLGADIVNRMSKELCHDYPNTYCFTKALAEEAVLTHARDLPICIFRPGIIIPMAEEPIPGWIDNLYGPMSILYGVSHGVLRAMHVRKNVNASLVPVDYCTNLIMTCAWHTAKEVRQCSDEPPVIYNLVPDPKNDLKWGQFQQSIQEYGFKMPLSRMIWYPMLVMCDTRLQYLIMNFFCHTIPGYLTDFALLLLGKRRRMVKTYRRINKTLCLIEYFTSRDWSFCTQNTKALWKSLSPEDQQMFPFDMLAIDWCEYFQKSLVGIRRFIAKEDPSTLPKGIWLLKVFYVLHRMLQVVVYGGGGSLLLWMAWKIYQFFC